MSDDEGDRAPRVRWTRRAVAVSIVVLVVAGVIRHHLGGILGSRCLLWSRGGCIGTAASR